MGLLLGMVLGPFIINNVKALVTGGEKKLGITAPAGYY